MQQGSVIDYGTNAGRVLAQRKGSILAVFSSTVYLQADDSICCLGSRQLVNGPLNIRTTIDSFYGLSPGNGWIHQHKTLFIADKFQLDTQSARCKEHLHSSQFNLSFAGAHNTLCQRYTCLENVRRKHAQSRALDNKTNRELQKHLQRYLTILTKFIERTIDTSKQIEIPEELIHLIGCGDGLTPSGDDVLIGVLLALAYFNQDSTKAKLSEWIQQNAPKKTSTISEAHLLAACEGQANSYLHGLLHTLTLTTKQPTDSSQLQIQAQKLTQYGHSSGYYALTGIQIVVKALLKQRSAQTCMSI